MSVSVLRPTDLSNAESPEPKDRGFSPVALNPQVLNGVRVSLEARLGDAAMTVEELMDLKTGSVVCLGAGLADLVGVYLNGTLIARGEAVAVEDKFAVRIVEIAAP